MHPAFRFFAPILLGLALLPLASCGSSAATPTCPKGGLAESGSRGQQRASYPPTVIKAGAQYSACLATSDGLIKVKLEPKAAPLAVNNLVYLATHKFYTRILFHRVIAGFMIQTGDPTGTGSGGPGYSFKVENSGSNYTPGTVAMANTGQPNSNGSQFFICDTGTGCAGLDSSWAQGQGYTILGHVTSGMNVVHKLATVTVTNSPSGEKSSPVKPIYLLSVQIYRTA